MNTKIILGISLAAAFVISMIASQSAIADGLPEYLQIKETKVTVVTDSDGNGILKAEIKTEDKIPKKGEAGAFGYGLATAGLFDGEPVLALTTHICAADTPYQGDAKSKKCDNPVGLLQALTGGVLKDVDHDGAKFHAHMLVLTKDTSATWAETGGIAPACDDTDNTSFAQVNMTATLAYNTANESSPGALDIISPDWTVKVHGDKIRVGNVPTDALPDSGVEGFAAYGIEGTDHNLDGIIDNLCLTTPTE